MYLLMLIKWGGQVYSSVEGCFPFTFACFLALKILRFCHQNIFTDPPPFFLSEHLLDLLLSCYETLFLGTNTSYFERTKSLFRKERHIRLRLISLGGNSGMGEKLQYVYVL